MQRLRKTVIQRWRYYLFYCSIVAIALLPQIARAQVGNQTITFEAKAESLATIINRLSKASGVNIGYPNDVKQYKRVSLPKASRTVLETLKALLKDTELDCKAVGEMLVIFKKQKAQVTPAPTTKLINVNGKVVDETGQPLPAITILLQGTDRGTTTNGSGSFELDQVPEDASIIAQGIGFPPQNFEVVSNMLIQLRRAISDLDGVQVIGYGTTTRRLNTGSVGTVKGEELERQPISNPIAALAGRVPGLIITQVNGMPGSGFTVQIRGQNSIQQDGPPLYIVDGIPFDATNPSKVVSTGQINVNNPLNTINPGDIESIDVLKDADATSIYGSRGANGVILITTKKGTSGSLNVALNIYNGWGKVTRTMKLLSPMQYREYRREALANDGLSPDLSNAFDLVGLDTTIENDWYKILAGETASSNNVQLSVSGGNRRTQFSTGANYYRESTVFPGNTDANRKALSFSLNHASDNGRFNLQFKSAYSFNKSNLISTDITQRYLLPPYGFTLKDDNGNLVWNEATLRYGNPLAGTLRPYIGITDMLNTNLGLTFRPIESITLILNGGYNLLDYDEKLLSPKISQSPEVQTAGAAIFGHSKTRTWSIEPQIKYDTRVASYGKLSLLLGGSWQESEKANVRLAGSNYKSDALLGSIAGAGTVTVMEDYSLYRYQAGFARLSFNWHQTYLFNASARRDASSRFGPGNRFANFGSIAGGWIFSNTRLISDKAKWLSYGKLRASYGTSGNDGIGNYGFLDTYTPQTNMYQQSLSLVPTRLFNPNYSWEQFRKFEAALELGLFKDRIYFSAARFRNRSVNQLISYNLPSQTGFQLVLQNFPGVVQNTGWELELRTENIQSKSLSWSTSFNFTAPKNALVSFPNLESSSQAAAYRINEPLSVFLGYQFQGVDPETGIYKLWDKDGDGSYTANDYIVVGNFDPSFYGGFQNTISLKGFSLDFLFQFTKQKGRHPLYNSSALGIDGNQHIEVLNHWRKPGDITPYAKLTSRSGSELYDMYFFSGSSSARLTDASFIRLKNMSLSYKLPMDILRHAHLGPATVYMEAQNLLTITNYEGPDPETQSTFILPPLRMIAAGIKVQL